MKICWYDDQRLGVVENDTVFDVSGALNALPTPSYPAVPGDLLITHLDTVRARIAQLRPDARGKPVAQARFLSPVANPGKIIGVPVNYHDHVAEAQADKTTFATDRFKGGIEEQGLFLKATSALVGPAHGVRIRFPEKQTHHEVELGVVIGKQANHVSEAEALSMIAGYSIALDMTVRGPQDRSQRKSVDTYAVLGPWLVTADEIPHPQELDISLSVNGAMRQQSNTAHMIMYITQQISWASSYYTLYPGDIIMTGTSAGVGPVTPGDAMHCSISGIGTMDVRVHPE